ncbi:MAG TPA: hypothetical protein VE684_10290 [Crenalkalicoccus sp.]|jgi:hypothetical protein|nr:hypothetical protein [Crenalkalicoccus sp.]
MITGPDFIWLHFPKTGGTEVAAVLQARFGENSRLAFDTDGAIWHHSIAERQRHDPGFVAGGRAVICGFRRLVPWLISRVEFEVRRNPQHRVTRAMVRQGRFLEASGIECRADAYARKYSEHPVAAWIRQEHLVEDFCAAFAPHLRFDPARIQGRFHQRNASPPGAIRDPVFWFTPEEMAELYAANPVWAGLERQLYGATLAEAA